MIDGMHPLTIVCQRITEEKLGKGKFKPEWKQGHDKLGDRLILWTTIECKCGAQVYFDKNIRRHVCSKCGEGF